MTVVVGIRFKDSGKVYFFDPGDMELSQGDMVIVETVRGPEMAKVAYERHEVTESEIVGELKPVVRMAEDSDFERMRLLHERHDEVLNRCAEKIRVHNLPMNLVRAEYSFDGSRLTFYFTSEKRVDFRMLVRDLARTFRSRIELRQIGPRDEAKLLGGIGPCGRLLCCATFLPDYARVSIKMAKDQDLPLNPSKISGVCGRLLCCLSYEHEQYIELRAELPRRGAWVQTPDGPGEVVAVNVLKQTVTVQLTSSGMQDSYSREQIHEATSQVHAVARGRAQVGITPVQLDRLDEDDPGFADAAHDEDEDPQNAEQRELMDTLAWLEEGAVGSARTSVRRDARSASAPRSPDGAKQSSGHKHADQAAIDHTSAQSDEPSAGGNRRKRRRSRRPRDETQPVAEQQAAQTNSQSPSSSHSKKKPATGKASSPQPEQKAARRRRVKKRPDPDQV